MFWILVILFLVYWIGNEILDGSPPPSEGEPIDWDGYY